MAMRFGRAAVLAAWAGAAWADGEPAGTHDHYVLALSWQPAWCAAEGNARGDPTCRDDDGWVLHGLWPQYERGWPSWCPTDAPGPSTSDLAAIAPIMGSDGLARHQWRKHGSCSGLAGADYLALSRRAFEDVERPAILRRVREPMRLPPSVIEEAFLEANPGIEADGLTVTCRDDRIAEARVCLTLDLEPRRCGADAARDCTARDAILEPVR